jgi:miniconductance mechanosensitive channel
MMDYLAELHPLLPTIAAALALAVVALLADLLVKWVLVSTAQRLARATTTRWDDALIENKLFHRLALLVPGIVVYHGINTVPGLSEASVGLVRNVSGAWLVLSLTLALIALLSAVNWVYELGPAARERPIKGFIQLAKMVFSAVGGILIIAALLDRSPVILLSGLGAMTAVLLIVFRDTLLSLAASIQLSSQQIIRVGDWLEIPQFGADGDVIDVALYTVTVQNWDKTITTIPTHRLISDSFKNWRGMQEAGGRRIKRSINLDMNSIRFLSDAEIERFRSFALLRDYLEQKTAELAAYNANIGASDEPAVNLRRLTNIGTLRAYIAGYLRHHPRIHQDMTLIVRQLQPGPDGLPIEIYCFTNDTNWVNYEGIQSDLFDHITAIVPEFGLRLFQNPAGSDLQALRREGH